MTDAIEQAPDAAPAPAGWRRNIVLFLTGQTVSLFGSSIVGYAVMWHLTLETKSGMVLATLMIIAYLPQAFVSPFGGVVADRVNRKWLIVIADSTIAVTTLILALIWVSGNHSLWLIYISMVIRSIAGGFQQPAVNAMIPQLVPQDSLMRVNGVNQTLQSAMALLAPATAGVVYGLWGLVPAFFTDVVTAAIGVGLLVLVPLSRTPREDDAEPATIIADIRDGMGYAWDHVMVRWVMVVYAVVFMLMAAPSVLMPLMLARSFSERPLDLTILELAYSIGMMIAGAVIATMLTRRSRQHMMLFGTVGCGIVLIAMGLSPTMWFYFAMSFLCGIAVPTFTTPAMTLLQEKVDEAYMGRVFSLISIVAAVAVPLAMVVIGPLSDMVTVQSIFVVTGVLGLVFIAWAFASKPGRAGLAEGRAFRAEQVSSQKETGPGHPESI